MSIEQQIDALQPLLDRLLSSDNSNDKIAFLFTETEVEPLIQTTFQDYQRTKKLSSQELAALAALFATGQGRTLFGTAQFQEAHRQHWDEMIRTLVEIDQFYGDLGGLLGYHLAVLKLIQKKLLTSEAQQQETYNKPEGMNIASDDLQVRRAVIQGINALPRIAEIYPVGGAGDRLDLREEKSDKCLPAARLLFCGRSLLHGLIRDLYAREYLYYKLHGQQLMTPVGLMTSHEKQNHAHIEQICQEDGWLGRPKSNFFLFTQPLAPVITKEGDWVMSAPFKLLLKPGGHGVMWKQAQEMGVLDKFIDHNRSTVLVRQINNPLAGTDNGILAFLGEGFAHKHLFGFLSCPRFLNASEGMLVLAERRNIEGGWDYHIGNIEYTEFSSRGIADTPITPDAPYSIFPANTNILFADLEGIKRAVAHCPIPGMLINMKSKYTNVDVNGVSTEVVGGRLESTMQNISDVMIDTFQKPLAKEEQKHLSTYIVYNDRNKTMAATKVSYTPEKPMSETPEAAFYVMMQNGHDLLSNACHVEVPSMNSSEDYLKEGPSLLFLYHPALGPLYSVIAQKIRGGHFDKNAEVQLEIADVDIQYLHVKGSLLIEAESVIGKPDDKGILRFGPGTGKCTLKNVFVENRGIDRTQPNIYWRNKIARHEAVTIRIMGNGEFYAENVTFRGDHQIEVPDGHRLTARQEGQEMKITLEPIEKPTWQWNYSINDQANILLERQ
jgi:hypothetical protein